MLLPLRKAILGATANILLIAEKAIGVHLFIHAVE